MKTTQLRFLTAVIALSIFAWPLTVHAATLVSEASEEASEMYEDIDQTVQIILEDSLTDHQAKVFELVGEVWFKKTADEDWKPLGRGYLIDEGDRIKTGTNAYAVISYDESFLNYVRIEEKTLMEFQALEPTVVKIEDGSIFNNLDGLLEGSFYETVTPTSVSAVRGTSFERSYDASSGTDDTSVVTGVVEVAPIDFDTGLAHKNVRYDVKADHSIALDRKRVALGNFEGISPKTIPQKRREHLQVKRKQFEERVMQHSPDRAEKIQASRRALAKIKERPKQAQALVARQGAGARPAQLAMHQKKAAQNRQNFKERNNHFSRNRNNENVKNNVGSKQNFEKRKMVLKERLNKDGKNKNMPVNNNRRERMAELKKSTHKSPRNFQKQDRSHEKSFANNNQRKKNFSNQQKQRVQKKRNS